MRTIDVRPENHITEDPRPAHNSSIQGRVCITTVMRHKTISAFAKLN
jgi:hypothetical protein